MKTALTFIFSFIVSSSGSFAFDTQNGQYLSEQDLIYTLQTIFFKPNLLVWEDSYELQYFNYNSVQFPPQNRRKNDTRTGFELHPHAGFIYY